MKKGQLSFLTLALGITILSAEPVQTTSENEVVLEPASVEEISTYSKTSAGYINQALQVVRSEEGKLANFIMTLKKVGFGKNPPGHPNHRDLTDEEKATMSEKDIKAQKDYVSEAKDRTARMGQTDILLLKSLDGNNNLALENGEAEKIIADRIRFTTKNRLTVDQNKDGKLTLKEYCLTVPAKGEIGEDGADWHQRGHFKYEDKDKDGLLSQTEIIAYEASDYTWKTAMILLAVQIAQSDKDANGVLTEDEFYQSFNDPEKACPIVNKARAITFPLKMENLWGSIYWVDTEKAVALLKLPN